MPVGPSIRGPKRAATRDERFPPRISDDLAFILVGHSVSRRERTPARSRAPRFRRIKAGSSPARCARRRRTSTRPTRKARCDADCARSELTQTVSAASSRSRTVKPIGSIVDPRARSSPGAASRAAARHRRPARAGARAHPGASTPRTRAAAGPMPDRRRSGPRTCRAGSASHGPRRLRRAGAAPPGLRERSEEVLPLVPAASGLPRGEVLQQRAHELEVASRGTGAQSHAPLPPGSYRTTGRC
jgi:hypothetical protein